jgi:hypothetical protein
MVPEEVPVYFTHFYRPPFFPSPSLPESPFPHMPKAFEGTSKRTHPPKSRRHLGGPEGGQGSGMLNARTMKAAIAWRLTESSGQKINGPVPQPVVMPRR